MLVSADNPAGLVCCRRWGKGTAVLLMVNYRATRGGNMRTRAQRMTLGAVLALVLLAGVAGVLGAASQHGRLRSDLIGPHSPTTYLNQVPYSPTMYCVRLLADC